MSQSWQPRKKKSLDRVKRKLLVDETLSHVMYALPNVKTTIDQLYVFHFPRQASHLYKKVWPLAKATDKRKVKTRIEHVKRNSRLHAQSCY